MLTGAFWPTEPACRVPLCPWARAGQQHSSDGGTTASSQRQEGGRRRGSPFSGGRHTRPGRSRAGGSPCSPASRTGLIWDSRLSTGAGERSWLTAPLARRRGGPRGGGRLESSTYKAVEHGAGDAAWQTHVHFPRRQLGRARASSISFLRLSAAAGSGSETAAPGLPQPPRSAAKGRSIPAAGGRSRCPPPPPPLAAADNGGREGGGRPDSTYLRRPPSTTLPSKCLPDRRDRKWRDRRRDHPSSPPPVPIRRAGTPPTGGCRRGVPSSPRCRAERLAGRRGAACREMQSGPRRSSLPAHASAPR